MPRQTQATSSGKDDTGTRVQKPVGILGTWKDGQAREGVANESGAKVNTPPTAFVDQDGEEPFSSTWRANYQSTQSSKCKNDNMNLLPRRGVRPPLSNAAQKAVIEKAALVDATSGEAATGGACSEEAEAYRRYGKHFRVSRAFHVIVVTPPRSML